MPDWVGELFAVLGLLVSLGAVAVGLIMISPGLALAAAGLTGGTLAILWLRRERKVPAVPPGTGQRDLGEFREENPDDDGRMEVRPL